MGRILLAALAALAITACSVETTTSDTKSVKASELIYTPKITSLGAGEALPFPGHEIHDLVMQEDLPSGVSLLELILEPRTLGAPPHIHADEDEIFVVMDGAVTFLNGETEVAAPTGTVASLPRGHFHGFWNPHDEPATLLLFIAPGEFAGFFDEVVLRIRADNPDSPEKVGAIIGRIAAQHNVTVDPSRFPPSALALIGPPQ